MNCEVCEAAPAVCEADNGTVTVPLCWACSRLVEAAYRVHGDDGPYWRLSALEPEKTA